MAASSASTARSRTSAAMSLGQLSGVETAGGVPQGDRLVGCREQFVGFVLAEVSPAGPPEQAGDAFAAPSVQGLRAQQLPLGDDGREQKLAGGDDDCGRPRLLVQARLLCRRAGHRLVQDRCLPVLGPPHGEQAHQLGPPGLPPPRPHLVGHGPRHWSGRSAASVPPSSPERCPPPSTSTGQASLLRAQKLLYPPCRQPGGAHGRATPGRQLFSAMDGLDGLQGTTNFKPSGRSRRTCGNATLIASLAARLGRPRAFIQR